MAEPTPPPIQGTQAGRSANPLSKLAASLPTYLHVSDLQGLAQLATQGVLGVAGLAETVQGSVYKSVAAPFGPLGARFVDTSPGSSGVKTLGITGLVYGSVRGITRLAGGAADTVLSRAVPFVNDRFGAQASSPQREAVLAAINGVLGDHLLATANPLAITMALRHQGQALPLDRVALAQRLPQATGKILVVAHGLCMNDLQWGTTEKNGKDSTASSHADVLARELGYTPIYLHYNTGLHTSVNGQQFAALLEQLLQAWPQPVQELSLMVHSMGGLVARSACSYAEKSGQNWRKQLRNIVFLGTPHHGAPLEQLGNWVDTLLGSNVVTRPFAAIGQIRSRGITDLRYGHVLESSWLVNGQEIDRFERKPDGREPLPLPEGVACFALAATTSSQPNPIKDQLLGDGLVAVRSALGLHDEARHALAFAPENQQIAYSMSHMALLSRPEVTAQLVRWLT
jgi:pimeloyl-ACP methyl ester carboxylesterase